MEERFANRAGLNAGELSTPHPLRIPTVFPVDVSSQEKRVEKRYAVDNGSLNLLPSARKFNPGAPVVSSGVRLPCRSFFRDLYSTVYGFHDFPDLGLYC